MQIDLVNAPALSTPVLNANEAPPAAPSTRQEVSRAVQQLNSAADPSLNRQLSISIDPQTQQPVVRVVDTSSGDVVGQVPLEYVLRIADLISAEKEQVDFARIS